MGHNTQIQRAPQAIRWNAELDGNHQGYEMSEQPKCEVCGEPMPAGEEMFKFHGYSGPCPKPPIPAKATPIETAYGLLWLVMDADQRVHAARHLLRDTLSVEARQRGVKAAQEMPMPPNNQAHLRERSVAK